VSVLGIIVLTVAIASGFAMSVVLSIHYQLDR
jgi:hypothetical protein